LTHHTRHSTRALLTRCCIMCLCNEHKYQRSKLGDRSKTRALYAMTEQFLTAKISDNALKQVNRTHSVLRQRSS